MKLRYLFAALCLCLLLVSPAAAAGGSGTEADPYIITTAAELQSIQNNLAAYYRLGADIDLSGVTWTPIGSTSAPFTGQLDGNDKTIKNLALSSTITSVGFFGCITSGAVIKNIIFQDCTVYTSSYQCGVIIGSIVASSASSETVLISNIDCVRCSAIADLHYVGCLVGVISAAVEISDCDVSYSIAESTSSYAVGCISGGCSNALSVQITNCKVLYSHTRAKTQNVGCFLGQGRAGSVVVIDSSSAQNSIAECTNGFSVGCFLGQCAGASSIKVSNSNVLNCLAKGTDNIGGVIGYSFESGSVITAQNCDINKCTIVATSNYAGGITGRCGSGITRVISGCTVTDSTIIASSYAASICPAFS